MIRGQNGVSQYEITYRFKEKAAPGDRRGRWRCIMLSGDSPGMGSYSSAACGNFKTIKSGVLDVRHCAACIVLLGERNRLRS